MGAEETTRNEELSHPLQPGMPRWPGDPSIERTVAAGHSADGYALHAWSFGEHTGTHIGAPAHRVPGGATLDAFPLDPLVLPIAVVRWIPGKSEEVGVEELRAWESRHGTLPSHVCVALHTGWDRRWPDERRVFERDAAGRYRWPGWTVEAVEWLVTQRQALLVGSDAPDIGPGGDTELQSGKRLAELGGWHLENLRRLERVPSRGATVILGIPPLVGATGAPVRVVARVPVPA